MCWETIQLPCQVAEGTLSVSNHLWRLWGGIQQLTPRLGIGHSEKQKQKPNFFCSSSDFSNCQVHYYRDKNSILKLDCPDYAMLECRWCMLWLSSGDVILQTLKWNQEVSNAPQYLHRKRKKNHYPSMKPHCQGKSIRKCARRAEVHASMMQGPMARRTHTPFSFFSAWKTGMDTLMCSCTCGQCHCQRLLSQGFYSADISTFCRFGKQGTQSSQISYTRHMLLLFTDVIL